MNFTSQYWFTLFCREAIFVPRQFLSQIYALLSVKFSGLKMCECKKMTNIRYVKIRVSWVVDNSHHQKGDWKSPKKIDQIDVSFEGAPRAIIILKCRCGLEENMMIKTMFNVKGVLLERPQKYYKIWGFFLKDILHKWIIHTPG